MVKYSSSSQYYLVTLVKLVFIITWITRGVNGGRFPSPIYADVAAEVITSTLESEGKTIQENGSLATIVPASRDGIVKVTPNITVTGLEKFHSRSLQKHSENSNQVGISKVDSYQGKGVDTSTTKYIDLDKAEFGPVSGWVYVLSGFIGLLLVASTIYCFVPFFCAHRNASPKCQDQEHINHLLHESEAEKVKPLAGNRNALSVIPEVDDDKVEDNEA